MMNSELRVYYLLFTEEEGPPVPPPPPQQLVSDLPTPGIDLVSEADVLLVSEH